MTQWQHSSLSLRQTTCRHYFGLQEMCCSVAKAYRHLFPLAISQSVCLISLFFFPPLKHRLTLFRASWKVISHYFLCCLSSHTYCHLLALCRCSRNYELCLCLTLYRGCD